MHAFAFQMKQCHLASVAVGRGLFRGTRPPDDPEFDGVPDMTPARFDLLYLVFGKGPAFSTVPGEIEMPSLRRFLGLAKSTVSEAVQRLVELVLVTCEYADWNGRMKVVRLTEEAAAARADRVLHLSAEGIRA